MKFKMAANDGLHSCALFTLSFSMFLIKLFKLKLFSIYFLYEVVLCRYVSLDSIISVV